MKKIILFHHSDSWGGGSLSLLTIANSLNKKYNVVVYLPHADTELFNEFKNRNICVRAVGDNIGTIFTYSGGPSSLSKSFILFLVKIIFSKNKITQIIDTENPDIVIVNSMTLCWIGRIASRKSIKSICFVRETATKSIGMNIIYYYLDHYFDGVAYLSEFDKKEFNGQAKVQKVIPDTILPDLFYNNWTSNPKKALSLSEESFYVLYVGGTILYPKGWNIVKMAMALLENYNIKLILTGNVTEDISCSKNILNFGTLKDMSLLYSATDIVIFPSTAPHQARPAYEAGFMRKPIIISDYEQTKEYVKNEVNGLTFKPGDAEELSKCILRLYHDSDLRKTLGDNNYREAVENHGYDSCENKLLSFVQDIE